MTYTVAQKVHVDLRVNDDDLSGDYGPGDVRLPHAVAELLVAQGLAVKSPKHTKKPAPTTTEPTPTEA